MTEVLICPCCGAPYTQGMTFCTYCKVNFAVSVGLPADTPQATPASQVPSGWIRHKDPWNGFSLLHPPGWTVRARLGAVGIREDPAGISAAGIYTQRLTNQQTAREFMQYYISLARQQMPNIVVWEAPATGQTAKHSFARYEGDFLGYHITGVYDVTIRDQHAFLSGFGCPTEQLPARKKWFQEVLASFTPLQRMERQKIQEVNEGAYVIWAPPGWQVDARLNRKHINNFATPLLVVQREPQGLAQAALSGGEWQFSTAPVPWGGSTPVMSYLPATQFFQSFILPQVSQQCQELQVVEIVDRPDIALLQMREMQKVGMDPTSQMVTAAHMVIGYVESGVRLRQRGEVVCIGAAGFGFGGMWTAYLSNVYRAPENEYAELEPILLGILDSIVYNPTWQQAQEASKNAYLMASFQDRMKRLGQISQTIHETNEMVYQGYQNRQASEDRISHEWSNATLGLQDMTDQSGSYYSVPSGYDQYWKDGLDNLYVGDWLTNPDPTWTRLEPV